MKQSDLNHLRRLLGWVRCDIGQDPAGQQQTMIDIAGKLPIDSIDADAKARLVEGYRRAEAVPVYVRDAVKALEKALTAVGRDPGVVAPRATAETRANTGFDPGAGAGREPVLDDVQIERGLAEIGVYVWGQRGEDWLAGVEYLARLLRAGEACPAVAPLQNPPDATAWPVACRDTPAAPPAPRRYDTACAGEARLPASPQVASQGDIAQRLRDQAGHYEQEPGYMDDAALNRAAADEIDRLNSELVKLRAPVTDERASVDPCGYVAVKRSAVDWLKDKFPALTIKAGLCERIGGRLYTITRLMRDHDAALASAPEAPTTDRAMLQSVLQDLEKSESVCPRCGHSDSCADMDVAYMIRDHLKGDASAHVADERAALADLLEYVDRNTCTHEDTHRGGAIWTICDGCGMKWADDEGGFVPHQDAPAVAAARAVLASAPDTAKETADKILRERMAPISEALGLDVMLASVLKDGFHIITFDVGALVYSIGADGTAMLRVSFNCPHAPDTLTADQVRIISQAASEIQPAPQPAGATLAQEAQQCVACEGRPSGDNIPCAVCGRNAAPHASADNVRDAALEACRLVVERFGPTEQDYIFSKRIAIQKCRAVHAAAQAEQGERQ
ncbi:hypothetical protein [Achromobacter deleyi]|uniref:hypothetical protein n=1 Tax=Achromobacter deleyi TaxID=1353891 RepID=UPI001465B09B|nr:hypothetical protein [Achromobacter deleyi]CAB3870902.1 hypothetical protein LMG3412_02749 [Achromobacter deleyi]